MNEIERQLQQLQTIAEDLKVDHKSHKLERAVTYLEAGLIVILLIAVLSQSAILSRRSPVLAHLECRETLQDSRQKLDDFGASLTRQRNLLQDKTESDFFDLISVLIPNDPTLKPDPIVVRQVRDRLLSTTEAKIRLQSEEQEHENDVAAFQRRVDDSRDPKSKSYCGEYPN